MAKPNSGNQAGCCSMEKQRLMKTLRQCDMCSSSYEDHQSCYSNAARESGKRAKTCMLE